MKTINEIEKQIKELVRVKYFNKTKMQIEFNRLVIQLKQYGITEITANNFKRFMSDKEVLNLLSYIGRKGRQKGLALIQRYGIIYLTSVRNKSRLLYRLTSKQKHRTEYLLYNSEKLKPLFGNFKPIEINERNEFKNNRIDKTIIKPLDVEHNRFKIL